MYLPQDTLLYALSLRQKAESLTWMGLFDSSLYFLNLAVPYFEKKQIWDEWAYCRIDQAVNYQFKEELDSANLYLQNVHNKIYKIFLPEEDKLDILATLLDLLGTQYSRLEGDYDKAIDSTLKALKIDLGKTHIRNLDSFYISGHYNNLASYYLDKGDYQRGLDNYNLAILYDKEFSYDPILNNSKGNAYYHKKNYSEAINAFQKAMDLIQDEKDDYLDAQMDALIGLAYSFWELGQYEVAVSYAKQAIDLPTVYRKFYPLTMMGNFSMKNNRFEEALTYYHRALDVYYKGAGSMNYTQFYNANIFRQIGNLYMKDKDPITALTYYQKALISNHATITDSLRR